MQILPHYIPQTVPYVAPLKSKDRAFGIITFSVFLAHFIVIGLSMIPSSTPEKKIVRKQVIVTTVQLNQKFEPLMARVEQTSSPRETISIQPQMPTLPTPSSQPPVIEKASVPVQSSPPIEKIPTIDSPPAIQKPSPVEQVQPKPTPKVEAKKVEAKPIPSKTIKPELQKVVPAKKLPAPAAPVKKVEVAAPKPKPEVDKKALETQKKALEAEKAKQQREKAKQEQIVATEAAARLEQQQQDKQLRLKFEESMAQVEKIRNKRNLTPTLNLNNTIVPRVIDRLETATSPSTNGGATESQEKKYQDYLIARLDKDLILPDYGEVKVKLTITKEGKVSKVEATSPSEKNRKYIEKTLPTLIFPPFGTQFDREEQHTFTLNLKNK